MRLLFSFFLSLFLAGGTLWYQHKNISKTYNADITFGHIGKKKSLADDPFDNVFHVIVPNLPEEYSAWLSYELKGVTHHSGIARSINDQTAVGGYFVSLNNDWTLQREQIKSDWLKKGDNVIRFTIPENAKYAYQIKHLKIEIMPQKKPETNLIMQTKQLKAFGDKTYLKGFVTEEVAELKIEDTEIPLHNGAFELVHELKHKTFTDLEITHCDGRKEIRRCRVNEIAQADYFEPFEKVGSTKIEQIDPLCKNELTNDGLKLSVPSQALANKQQISVTNLRNQDVIALNPDMVNITKQHTAYRCLPHGTQFTKPTTIAMAYDSTLIPVGYTVHDLQTFYFDEQLKKWKALSKDTLLANQQVLVSKTTHFTDFITGIIKVPESPETNGYTPNSIKDIKAADPTMGIISIAPPVANNQGTANLSFPLKLPIGRNGMQPNLSINYNSEGGNGWLGLGWNLTTPSISIDTRWGVPRFNPEKETETYLFNGEQLSPLAHRGVLKDRKTDRQFYPRVEGGFTRIIRHGNHPNNYWWEVSQKDGTINSYGGTAKKGIQESTVLRDNQDNIVEWKLMETRNPNENFIQYHYQKVEDKGVADGHIMGYNLYLDRISYTGYRQTEGSYQINFIRDRNLGETKRKDIQINGRLGFKRVTADLLRKIEIGFKNQPIRTYELQYQTGAFFKTLLKSIAELDQNSQEFYQNEFQYFNTIEGRELYTSEKAAQIPSNKVKKDFILGGLNQETSALSGNSSKSNSTSFAITAGVFDGNFWAKSNTVGGSFGLSSSEGEMLTTLIDLDGDGLLDKVFKKEEERNVFYCKNLSTPYSDKLIFAPAKLVKGITSIGFTKTSSSSKGLEAHPLVAFVGRNDSKSRTINSTYFSHFNNDNLIDMAINGQVFFNHINEDGLPEFLPSSVNTLDPMASGASIDGSLIDVLPQAQEELIDENPLHDLVRVWQAPFDGEISVIDAIHLIKDNSEKAIEYKAKDGVKISLQHKASIVWSQQIQANDFNEYMLNQTLEVNKGDYLYFRLQSIFNGAYDLVQSNPKITYIDKNPKVLDANGQKIYEYQADKDFILASCQSLTMPLDGKISIDGQFSKPITSDDVQIIIKKRASDQSETIIYEAFLDWDDSTVQAINLNNISVDSLDELFFQVNATTNIDWSKIKWQPQLYYTDLSNGTSPINSKGEYILKEHPAVDFSIYSKQWNYVAPIILEGKDTQEVSIRPLLAEQEFGKRETGTLTLSVKGNNKLYAKKTFNYGVDKLSDINKEEIKLKIIETDTLFVEYHSSNPAIVAFLNRGEGAKVIGKLPNTDLLFHTIPVFSRPKEIRFGSMYRQWGAFAYNGNRDRAAAPIKENELRVEVNRENPRTADNINDTSQLDSQYDPSKAKFIMLFVDAEKECWRGYDTLTYIYADRLSSSRMGEDDVRINRNYAAGTTAFAPIKITTSKSKSYTGSLLGAGYSDSEGTLNNLIDAMDLNGDGYLDILSDNKIQYTNAFGGLESDTKIHGLGTHTSKSDASNKSLGGALAKPDFGNCIVASVDNIVQSFGNPEAKPELKASIGFSVSGNMGESEDEVVDTWMDINGDGLADKLYKDGQVALNIGYSFLPKEKWNFSTIRQGETKDRGLGLGVNLYSGSIQAGIGGSKSKNRAKNGLQDINGDGLIDRVIMDGDEFDKMYVALNTGNGFAESTLWHQGYRLDEGTSDGESANVAFTGCIPIIPILPVAKICFNPGKSWGSGVSRQQTRIADINGDGFPDLLKSKNDGQLSVKIAQIGKTNLLKSVKRPMGTEISMDYERTGNTFDLPQSKWLLTAISLTDGVEGDGADVQKYRYNYKNPYHDRRERSFYGFGEIKTDELDTQNGDVVYRSKISTYANADYYQKGLLLSENVVDGKGNLYTSTKYKYELKNIQTGAITNTLPNEYAAFPATVSETTYYYEGKATAGLSHRKTFQHDRLGNIIQYEDFGDGEPEDYVKAEITYHDLKNSYIKSVPKSIQVFTQDGLIRSRSAAIDNKGNVINIQQFLADGKSAAFDMTYDELGNLTSIQRPTNYKNERFGYTYQYDEEVATYVTKVTDSYSYTSTTEYEFLFGQTIKTTDRNGQEMVYKIDERGRPTTITGPYELANGQPYTIKFNYHPESPVPYAETRHYDPEHNKDIITVSFTDGLGRPLQVKKTGALYSGEGQDDQVKMIVSGRVLFDAFGRAVAQYYPTTEPLGQATQLNRAFDQIKPIRTQYDVLDRPILTTLPDKTTTSLSYNIASDNMGYPRFQTQIIDQLGNKKEAYTDIRERKRATTDHGPNGEIWTNFEYNAISELLAMIDDEGNTIAYKYDQLGRKLSVNHPDAGLTTFSYDLAGNQLTKITANIRKEIPNGGAIRYSYDHERLVQIDYPKNTQNQVKYHYGDADAPYNRIGRIWLQEDATGGQEFYYDALGNTSKTIRTIVVNEANTSTYVTELKYDTWNRIQQMIYPDGEVLEYDYNRAGKLTAMSGVKQTLPYQYVEQLSYDEFEQRVFCKYGNGATTHYDYEPERRRLSHLKVAGKEQGMITNNQYQYDAVSNILSIDNQVAVPSSAYVLGGPAKHQFKYDKLYRLTSANAVWNGYLKEENYELEMGYDNMHNIISKKQQHLRNGQQVNTISYELDYEYNTDRPHIASKIGLKNYEYDANGNLTYWKEEGTFSQRQIQWDEENRIKGISEDGYISQYTYDASGERVIKSHGGLQGVFADNAPAGLISHRENYTVYVNPYLVNTEKQFTKHYFIEGQRFLSKIGVGTFQNQKLDGNGITAGDLDYKEKIRQTKLANTDYYAALGIPPGIPTMPGYFGQPEFTDEPLPASETTDYTKPPVGWPQAPEPKDPNGPPGIPAWFIPPVEKDSVGAGYGYEGDALVVEENQYFYHPDHLGSTSYITDFHGRVAQHTQYTAFGESFVSQHSSKESQPYLFNGKELDEETGLYYYGARYYDPVTSLWQSVDPLAEKYPAWSPYNFTLQNPLKFVDPDGRESVPLKSKYKKWNLKSKIDSGFGKRNIKESGASTFHNGIDINFSGGGDTDKGAPVLATHEGIAEIKDNNKGGKGRAIVITSPDKQFKTKYFHLDKISIKDGARVNETDIIGELGGSAYGKDDGRKAHLHYEIHKLNPKTGNYQPFDPTQGKGNKMTDIVNPQKWIKKENTNKNVCY